MSTVAGIDQAPWDIKGKVLGQPVYKLLGGLMRDKMKVCSWVGGAGRRMSSATSSGASTPSR